MATHAFVPILGKRIRATTLDQFGAVADSDTAQIASDGFITITLTAEVEDGTEIIQRKANGQLCVNERMANSFKRFTVEVEFCGVHPEFVTKMTNAEPYMDANDEVAGFTVGEGEITEHFAFELWTGLSGASAEGGQEPGGYFLLPFVNGGTFGDIEITGEDAINFTVTGAMTKGGNQWGTGPYDVVATSTESTPGPLPTALDPFDHLLVIDTSVAPPPVSDTSGPVNGGTEPASVSSFSTTSTTTSTSGSGGTGGAKEDGKKESTTDTKK